MDYNVAIQLALRKYYNAIDAGYFTQADSHALAILLNEFMKTAEEFAMRPINLEVKYKCSSVHSTIGSL